MKIIQVTAVLRVHIILSYTVTRLVPSHPTAKITPSYGLRFLSVRLRVSPRGDDVHGQVAGGVNSPHELRHALLPAREPWEVEKGRAIPSAHDELPQYWGHMNYD